MAALRMSGQVNIRALTASVLIHLLVLGSFLFFKFAKPTLADNSQSNTASLNVYRTETQQSSVLPKPKMVKPGRQISGPDIKLDTLSPVKVYSDSSQSQSAEMQSSQAEVIQPSSGYMHQVDFFGSKAVCNYVCYVVDASGSMHGSFHLVKAKLKESIGLLEQDQFFYITFFNDGQIVELPKSGFMRASNGNKDAAVDFMDGIRPSGATNAIDAFSRVFQRCGEKSSNCVIFFLTDGFDLENNAEENFIDQIKYQRKSLSPSAQINTIGFNSDPNSSNLLAQIAGFTNGQHTEVGTK